MYAQTAVEGTARSPRHLVNILFLWLKFVRDLTDVQAAELAGYENRVRLKDCWVKAQSPRGIFRAWPGRDLLVGQGWTWDHWIKE